MFAVDCPGHGKTAVTDDYTMSANRIGSDLAKFIKTVIGAPVCITGNSSGGLLTVWLAANEPDLVKAIVLEDPPLFSSEYPEIEHTVADKLFTASYYAVEDSNYEGNFLDYWIKNGTEFFKTYTGPFSQQLIGFAVNSYKRANPGKPVEIAFLPVSVQEMLRGLNYYDPRFGAAFHDGTWNEGFDHAEALQKIKCPTLLIQANFEEKKVQIRTTSSSFVQSFIREQEIDHLIRSIQEKGQKIVEVHILKPSLEDVYFRTIGRKQSELV